MHRTKRPEDRDAIAVVDRGIQTLKKDLATRAARKGGQWSDHFERAAGAYNARPHETAHGAPEDVEKQSATEFRVLQDNTDKFSTTRPHRPAREGRAGRGRLPSADERGEELQPSVRRRAAAGGRGLHDRPQHGGPRDPAEAGAAGAGQRQRGGPADETQAGGCEAAGRLPGASEAQDPRLAFLDIAQAGRIPGACSSLFWVRVLGKPVGRTNQMSGAWANRAKPVQKLFLQALHKCRPCKNSFSAQNRAKRAIIPPGICAICAIWVLQGNPLNIHSPPAPYYMCYMCYIILYRGPTYRAYFQDTYPTLKTTVAQTQTKQVRRTLPCPCRKPFS